MKKPTTSTRRTATTTTAAAAAAPVTPPADIHRAAAHEPDAPASFFRDHLEKLRPQMAALDEKDLVPVNFDVTFATTRAAAAAPRLRELRPRIAALPPGEVDLALFDSLEPRSRAAYAAHGAFLVASKTGETVAALNARAVLVRDKLQLCAQALVEWGLLPPDALASVHKANGYRDTADDLIGLVTLMRGAWTAIENRAPVREADLDAAEALANELFVALGARATNGAAEAAAADDRRRAVTLFVQAYDEARRVVTFLRWHEGDGDELLPSIYNRGAPARRKPADAAQPAQPAAQPAASAQPAHENNAPTRDAAAVAVAEDDSVGMPNSRPFIKH